MAKQKGKRAKHYAVFAQRLDKENQDWLYGESINYKSWNLFFKELIKRYVSVPNMSEKKLSTGAYCKNK